MPWPCVNRWTANKCQNARVFHANHWDWYRECCRSWQHTNQTWRHNSQRISFRQWWSRSATLCDQLVVALNSFDPPQQKPFIIFGITESKRSINIEIPSCPCVSNRRFGAKLFHAPVERRLLVSGQFCFIPLGTTELVLGRRLHR